MKEIIYPIRINKYLAYKGYGTRRETDALVSKSRVFINNKKAVLGSMVEKDDNVEVKQKGRKKYIYLAYNKPKNIITHSPGENEIDVRKSIGRTDVFPLGRLDKNSEGLIILSNDGRLTERLLSPDSNHEKEYIVEVNKDIKESALKKLESGVNIEGYKTRPCKVKKLSPRKIKIILTEGKKHQVRRMLASVGYTVLSLKRVRILNIKLHDLKINESRDISGEECKIFLEAVGLTD